MSKRPNKRSVAIQSADFYSEDFEIGQQPVRLQKKTGFRNLLRKSVIVGARETDDKSENFSLSGEQRSKGVQTMLGREFSFQRCGPEGQSLEFSLSKKHSLGREDESGTTSEMMRVMEQGTGSSNPGTSRMMSGAFSLMSVSSQVNDFNSQREGSLAVVYSYGEKAAETSVTSSFPLFYGSQGSRRLSDETVLLIEDYQSYDQTNAARRQDQNSNRRHAGICCSKKLRRPVEVLRKPLPIDVEKLDETDEIVCRICHEGEEIERLIQPCLCKGSVGSVHAHCLKTWLEQSNTNRCELCNYPYAIRQTKKYPKCLSVRIFYKTVIDRRALAYDITSFVIITPLTLVGVVMCIQASVFSGDPADESNYQIGYITKIGMIMLSGTITVAYAVWFYALISFHYKAWRNWYNNCFDVEVIPVRMTSEERLEAARRFNEQMNRRHLSREQGSTLTAVLQSRNHSFYQRRISVPVYSFPAHDR